MSSGYMKTEAARWAEATAKASGLPGYHNGPGDAYRHILWVAETARTTGTLAGWAQGEANELKGVLSNPADETAMDRHNNNQIALRIARAAKSREDIERLTQAEIAAAHWRGGTGADGTARWLDQFRWGHPEDAAPPANWPPKWADEDSLRVERLLTLPVEEWDEHSVRLVVASRIYHNANDAKHAEAQAKVQDWLHADEARRANILRTTFGPVTVDPYTRGDGTKVEGHTRSAPTPRR